MSSRRGYALALIVLLLAGACLIASGSMPWASGSISALAGAAGSGEQVWSGSMLAPMAQATGVLALAGVAGIVATRRSGRLIVGLVLLLAGLTGAWASARVIAVDPRSLVDDAGVGAITMTWWPWAALVGCLLVGLIGGVTVGLGRAWPGLTGRYETAIGTSAASPWEALDAGRDPTAESRGDAYGG